MLVSFLRRLKKSTGDTHSNTTVDNVTTVSNWAIGDWIRGSGIPDSTRITNIAGTTITLSRHATATAWALPAAGVKGCGPQTGGAYSNPTFITLHNHSGNYGATGARPTLASTKAGLSYWDTNLGKAIFWTASPGSMPMGPHQ